jgi:hypothetical protein
MPTVVFRVGRVDDLLELFFGRLAVFGRGLMSALALFSPLGRS